jgi:hypothetical protein
MEQDYTAPGTIMELVNAFLLISHHISHLPPMAVF